MQLALFGYGKMGRMLQKMGNSRGHTIGTIIDNLEDAATIDFSAIDVAIDFSTPEAAFSNISRCLEMQIPVISGTTGWLDQFETVTELCKTTKGAFLYASNFSLGVNIFFELNRQLAKMMHALTDYQISLEEIHHTQKLDAPSGTAITLAEGILEHSRYTGWSLEEHSEDKIPISSVRKGDIPGTHTINYSSPVDNLCIRHTAHNREGFALGALIAAEWIVGKTGVFSMKDVLNIG